MKRKTSNVVCSKNGCNRRGKLSGCRYCHKSFCLEHRNAFAPSHAFEGEWPPRGHPCPYYSDHSRLKREEERTTYSDALNRLTAKPPKSVVVSDGHYPLAPSRGSPPEPSKYALTSKRVLFLLLLLGLLAAFFASGALIAGLTKFISPPGKACSDGTNSLACSATKPFYCENGNFTEKPDLCGCPNNYRIYFGTCIRDIRCSDGTLSPECSAQQPLQCANGVFVNNVSECGCPNDFKAVGNDCIKIQRCSDGTVYGECSAETPFFCSNGSLIQKAGVCGCPEKEIASGDSCASIYETAPLTRNYGYLLHGNPGTITFTVYGGLDEYLSAQSRTYSCTEPCPSQDEVQRILELREINDDVQKTELAQLSEKIRGLTGNRDDQARIAISLVQRIPYDFASFNSGNLKDRYPYQVIYQNAGVCGEKSKLLAFLLRELGFGVALLEYPSQNHEAVGIKCPVSFSVAESGYCFVEVSQPAIPTDNQENYVGAGKLSAIPGVIVVSGGYSMDSISEEYNDAQRFIDISKMGSVLDEATYAEWASLVKKYGIKLSQN